MARPFPSIRKPSAGWTGAVNYTLEDHIASPYPHPIYPRKDGVLPNDTITRHMADAGAHRKYFLSTYELIFTKAEYEANKTRDGAAITDPTTRESSLYQYLITAPALAAILADYSASGGFSHENLVKEILGAPGSHTYTMCTAEDDIKAPSIGLFVELFDKFNAVVGILPNQSKPTVASPTALTSVFALKSHTHAVYDSRGASHDEIWEAINAGGGGSGGMGGVIDGTLCTDAATGEPCVTEIELHDGTNPNNQTSYTYRVQHNCLLFIQLKNAIITDNESSSVPRDCILVKAGEQVIGTLTDNLQDLWNELDNDGLRIPVKVGTTITLVGDGTTPIFDESSLTANSKIVFSEFELTPLSMRVGMPDYATPTDITDSVCRTDIGVSKNYAAAADGFVLFRYVGELGQSLNIRVVGKVAGVDVFNSFYLSAASDASIGSGVIPVRKGDTIDLITSDRSGTTYVANNGNFEVIFYPLASAEHTEGEGPIEFPVFEHAFTNTTDNPFIGTSIPSANDLTITTGKIESVCGRSDIDLSTCNISLKIDVFTPKMNGATVVVDDNGFAKIDNTHPVYRNEAIVYCDADNSPAGYYNDYSRHLDVSIVDGAAKIAWTEAFKKASATNSVAASFTLPALSSLLAANSGKTSWDDFNNSYGKFIDVASELGLSDCYIRLTAVIDPCTKIINQTVSKAGMFIDGEANVIKKVDYTEWDDVGDATNGYDYIYTVQSDCWIQTTFLLYANSTAGDKITVTLNEGELFVGGENPPTGNSVSEYTKTLGFPAKAGSILKFHSKAKPNTNIQLFNSGTGVVETADYAIKITEFKMSTELNPAKFPSLAVRICDVDCREEYTGQDSDGIAVTRALPSTTGTGAYVSWTETQFRSIFGSAFDFDHAKFDVTAVFYVGNSANDYDSATNKLEDTGIEVSLANQGQQIRPFVVTDIVNGERVAKLSLPGIAYFCSNVAYDTTDGFKLVPRTDGAHIGIGDGGNNLIGDFSSNGKKVRMRLLLHVSDRRGEMADGGRIPNGISPNSKMVRQGDMSIAAYNPLGNVAYTNEITITESGTCIIMSNFDSDGSGVDYTIVAVQALIGGNWTTIQTAPTQTVSDGRGVQSFNFPVEAGTKIRIATDAAISGAAGNISGTRSDLDAMFTHAHQALCWVIPTSKYYAPEYNLPGSAGVIDGSIWKKADGTDEVTSYSKSDITGIKSLTYNVKNDCYLYISFNDIDIEAHGIRDLDYIDVSVNGVPAARLLDTSDASDGDNGSVGIFVARGSVIELIGDGTHSLFDTQYTSESITHPLTFTEFKLRATNVVAAMPDWDDSKKVVVTDGYVAESDGFLRINVQYGQVSGHYSVLVNDIVVWKHYDGDEDRAHGDAGVIPICQGDKVTISKSTASTQTADITFYPVKMREVRTTSAASASAIEVIAMSSRSDAPSWWKVYSNGWCEQGGQQADFSEQGEKVFNLPIEMSDTNYTVQTSTEYNDAFGVANGWTCVVSKTTTKMTARQEDNGAKMCYSLSGWISGTTLLAIKNGTYTFFPGQSET